MVRRVLAMIAVVAVFAVGVLVAVGRGREGKARERVRKMLEQLRW